MLHAPDLFRKTGKAPDRKGDARLPRHIFLSDENGFSFIDLVLATVVLTIGVLAMMDLQVIAARSNASSKSMVLALSLAEAKMEAIKNKTFTSILSEAPATLIDSNITYTTTVTVTNDQPIAGVKKVNVAVAWQDVRGQHTIPMAMVIAPQ